MERVGREGNPHSKIIQLMQQQGYSKPVNIEIATVTAAPPDLKINLDGDGLELDKGDLIVSEHLTKHVRTITFKSAANIRLASSTITGTTKPGGGPSHTHGYDTLALTDVQNDFAIDEAIIEYQDELKVGDRVIVACLDEDMVYVVLDRAVWYA